MNRSTSNEKVINILPLVNELFPKNVILPIIAQALNNIEDEEFLSFALENTRQVWGCDTLGGIAYFGTIENMQTIKEQMNYYFQNMSDRHAEEQFYLYWQLDNYSLCILYEDYQAELNNPYPNAKDVLSVHFGTWTGDNKLFSVLENQLYIEGNDFWKYGEVKFDKNNVNQLQIVEEMKKTLLTIDNSMNDE